MPNNPFDEELEYAFRGREVVARSNHGETYRGFLDRVRYDDRHVILHGATRLDADGEQEQEQEHVGSAFVAHVDWMHLAEQDRHVERVSLADIEPSPYATREFYREQNEGYIRRTRQKGFVGTFPVVTPITPTSASHPADGYETVEGHKRLWVCRQAGFDDHPVEIRSDLTDWEQAQRFAADHIPTESHVTDDPENHNDWYSDADTEAAIRHLADRWGERVLDLPAVAFNVERLDVEVSDEPPNH
jgi:hypothetical protein